jgi:hypothetical protein
MSFREEGAVELPAVALFAELRYETVNAFHEAFGPAGTLGRECRVAERNGGGRGRLTNEWHVLVWWC